MILRERDANTDWDAASDGTLEERTYYCQNWRADVVALMADAGQLLQQIRYDPYGVPFGISKADVNGDGTVNTADFTLFLNLWNGGAHPLADWNFDGSVNTADYIAFLNSKNADTNLGRGVMSYELGTAGGTNRKGYAGYELDPVLVNGVTGEEWQGWYHIRYRVYASHLGRWTKRDPLGFVDGLNIYLMGGGNPLIGTDWAGLAYYDGGGGGCSSGCGGNQGSDPPKLPDAPPFGPYNPPCEDAWPELPHERSAMCKGWSACAAAHLLNPTMDEECYWKAVAAGEKCCNESPFLSGDCVNAIEREWSKCRGVYWYPRKYYTIIPAGDVLRRVIRGIAFNVRGAACAMSLGSCIAKPEPISCLAAVGICCGLAPQLRDVMESCTGDAGSLEDGVLGRIIDLLELCGVLPF